MVRTRTGLIGQMGLQRNGLAEVKFIKPHLEDHLAGYTRPEHIQLLCWKNHSGFEKVTLIMEEKLLREVDNLPMITQTTARV